MSLSSALAPCGVPGVAATNRTAASRFSRPQHCAAPAQLPGLQPQRRQRRTRVDAEKIGQAVDRRRRWRTRPRAACRRGRRHRRTAARRASASDRCRCAPLPAAPVERHRARTRFAGRAGRRPGRSRCARRMTASAAATGWSGASDTSSWSWPYSVWICSMGSPARSAAPGEVDQERRTVQRGADAVGRPRIRRTRGLPSAASIVHSSSAPIRAVNPSSRSRPIRCRSAASACTARRGVALPGR